MSAKSPRSLNYNDSEIKDFQTVWDYSILKMENDNCAVGTYKQYYYNIKKFHTFLLQECITDLNTVSRYNLQQFLNTIAQADLKNSSRNKIRSDLKRFLINASELDVIDYKWLPKIKKLQEYDSIKSSRAITRTDVKDLLGTFFSDDNMTRRQYKKELSDLLLILISISFGLRINETSRLQFKNFDLANMRLTVFQQKTKTTRVCYLNKTLNYFFYLHVTENLANPSANSYIFSNDNGVTHITSTTLAGRISMRFQRIGVDAKSHDCRRFYISESLSKVSLQDFQHLGTHKDIRSLMRYSVTDEKKDRETSEQINIFKGIADE